MKILREDEMSNSKETLPVSFVTDMVSKSWDEVGYLKEASSAIKDSYRETAKIESLMQDLMDAYLVFIGQLELYLNKEKDLDTSIEDTDTEDTSKETSNVDNTPMPEEPKDTVQIADLPEADFDIEPMSVPAAKAPSPVLPEEDDFEFFVDFDEPDMSNAPLSDKELYDEEGKFRTQRLNG